ncbi:MAG: carbohydrate kinase family protein [Candidatus Bathyarchaeota archaeon]|nr:carbohydrate kinase family protein [Candidatus Bathyarchaeota archaeon]
MSLDVVCFGALNMDRLYMVNRIAREEEEGCITGFKESPGGSAANTAAGLTRLRLKTGYIGKVSNDREGKLLLESFEKEGVDTSGVIISREGRSGVVIGFVDEEGQRALYVDPGVNDTIEFEEINLEYAGSAEFLHLTSFVGEKSFKAQKRLVEALSDIKVSLDPGELYARKGLEALKTIIGRTFVALLNENEMRLLTGKSYREGSKTLLNMGINVVAVKLGKMGCYVTDGKEAHLVAPYKVKVMDTTGAGDAFCAGFLYGLIKNKELYECGMLGNFVASRCIMETGAREGLPKLSDLHKM